MSRSTMDQAYQIIPDEVFDDGDTVAATADCFQIISDEVFGDTVAAAAAADYL